MSVVLIAMIVINAIASYKGFNDTAFLRKYEFHTGSIRAGEQYRMFTSGFIHADPAHLAFNMITLYLFAPNVIHPLGAGGFLLVYLISLVAGSLLTLYFHKNDYSYRALGASGAVMGVVFSSILIYPEHEIYFIPGYIFGIGYLLFSIYGQQAKSGNIGHMAHFGGAMGGYVVTLVLIPSLFWDQTRAVVLLALPIAVLMIVERTNKR